MERSFPPEGDPLFCHGCEEVVVIANATGSGQVHILDSKGTQSLLQFDNGSLPVFEEGAVISLWNHEEKDCGLRHESLFGRSERALSLGLAIYTWET